MAYSGAAMGAPGTAGSASASTVRQVKLERESELRVEVSNDTPLRLRLLTGTAEIFGTELPPEIWLNFPPRLKFAVFTWYGATIEMDGATELDYTADETPMVSYVNVHAILEGRRSRAKASSSNDYDSSQPPQSNCPLTQWKEFLLICPSCTSMGTQLLDLYKVLVKELARMLERQFTGNAESRAAGMVINTMGWIEGVGYELLLHAIDIFNANVILVLGQEKLWSMLKDVLKNKPNVDVVKLQKSGGVVSRNAKVRQKTRSYRIKEYFYGLVNDLSPHSNIANFSDLAVYRIGGGPQAPRSALPIGAEPAADPTRLVPVSVNRDLLHVILAVSFAKEPDEIISSNVAGFIYITDVDIQRKKITYLGPSAGDLPSKYLIVGTLTWLET
ncbi:protein CLP1 homolog isoform X2 [Juglans microcarpa x Juglans regia]|uniref:protein CLP1 homolog isoform X2 n=1 Tax=Juglans microcarpa x Juglans regia TaxID=2249226 RepID=UPI001B7E3E2D|nr:protein CLP1 homolog isoform X2 [Juglans microcarpa x Juglans regia]